MADKDFYTQKYGQYIRHYKENGWTYEKYSRMAVYVFLYNKVRGMPKSFGFSNDDVSWRFNDYIRDNFDELCKKYNIQEHIPGLDLGGDHIDAEGKKVKGGRSIFCDELNEYAQYATMLAGLDAKPDEKGNTRVRMPSDDTMIGLFEALKINRKSHFENIRANTKRDPGYNVDKDGKNKIGKLRAERYTVKKKIQDQKREMRETAFFGTMHGLGFVATGAVAAASAVMIFSPATILGAAALTMSPLGGFALGLTGLIIGGSIAAGAGRRFLKSCARFFGQFMHLRDHLIRKRGESGKGRGIRDIDRDIALNEAVKYAYNFFGDMVKQEVFFKRKPKQFEGDPDAGKMVDKDGNIIAFGPNNELTAADGSKYIFNEKELTLTGPVGSATPRTISVGLFGKLVEKGSPVDIPGLQIPYVESKKQVIPKKDDFIKAILNSKGKDRKALLPLIKADESESEFAKLYDRVKERYGYLYGTGLEASNFIATYKTIVEDNSEIVLEREDFYNQMFNISFEIDTSNPEIPPVGLDVDESTIDFTRYPSFEVGGAQFKYNYKLDTPIAEFVQALYELENDKERYERHQEGIKYQHYLRRTGDMMPVIFQRELFDKPLSGFTLRNCENLLSNKVVKDALERCHTGNKVPYVQNAIKYIQFEHYDPINPVRTDLGVSISAQFYSRATDMEEACVKFFGTSKTGPEWSDIQNITTQIENMTTKEQAKSIKTLIDTLTDARVKNYLTDMVERKENQCIHSKNYIVNELIDGKSIPAGTVTDIEQFAGILANLKYDSATDSYISNFGGMIFDEAGIRSFIATRLRVSSVPALADNAEKLLNKQCSSLERGYIDTIRGQTVGAIMTNSMSAEMEPLIKYIEELTFDKLGTQELNQFLIEKVRKMQPSQLSEYLRMKLRVKIEQLYEFRFGQGGIYTGENAMKELTEDLQKLERMTPILGDARKERILKGFEPKINVAFDRMLTMKEITLLEMKDPNALKDEIRNIRIQSYEAGGFKQFFERNSDASLNVLARLNKISTLIGYTDYLNGVGEKVPTQSDKKVPESKIFLGIYFKKDRTEGSDKLLESIKDLSKLTKDVVFEKFGVETGNIDNCKPEIEKLRKFLNNTSAVANIGDVTDGLDPAVDAAEQIALLLIYKRKVMSLFKAHLKRLTNGKPDIQSYIRSAEGDEVIRKIRACWEPLLTEIDAKFDELANVARAGGYAEILNGYAYKKAETTMQAAFAEHNIMNYVLSEDSVIMER